MFDKNEHKNKKLQFLLLLLLLLLLFSILTYLLKDVIINNTIFCLGILKNWPMRELDMQNGGGECCLGKKKLTSKWINVYTYLQVIFLFVTTFWKIWKINFRKCWSKLSKMCSESVRNFEKILSNIKKTLSRYV